MGKICPNFEVVADFSDFNMCYTVELPLQYIKNSGGVSKIKGIFLNDLSFC
jgi:hypothetical protein